jgi:hypothetical protein
MRTYFGPALAALGPMLWSGCDHAADEFAESCGSKCSHPLDHNGHEASHSDGTGANDHTHEGPNGGRLIVLGDENYHAELVIDHEKAEATVRVLDRSGRKPVCVDQSEITLNVHCDGRPHQIKLVAVDASDLPTNTRCCFRGTSDVLRGDCQLGGRLNIVIRGKPYTGRVAHHEGDHKLSR